MGSKYSKGDMVKCVKDFVMKSKVVAFKKGKVYSILEVNRHKYEGKVEYDYTLDSEVGKSHTMVGKDLDRYFKRVEVMPVLFHKYYCGCYGIPIDSMNGLIVKACDDDSGEFIMSIRDMRDKKHEPMKSEDQEELIHMIDNMLARGHGVTDFAFLIDRIMDKKGGE